MSKGAGTRDRIVARALDIASVHGIDGVTIGELAKGLELSKSGVFAHFRSKEELQLQVLKTAIESFSVHVATPALQAERGEPRLRKAVRLWLDWAAGAHLRGGCIFTSAAYELDDRPGALKDLLVDSIRTWLDTLERISLGALEEGHLRADLDIRQFVFELYGIFLSFTVMYRTLGRDDAFACAARACERLIESARP